MGTRSPFFCELSSNRVLRVARIMLRKLPTKQIAGEPLRQWFADDYFDLYVWYQPDGAIFGFRLCYEKDGDERGLTWMHTGAFRHERVDAGNTSPFDL